ncbi:uncharacterized protein OCT59_020610 [Rhizophagus irregularis]|nr:hypothetical protein OCT59_020610 [Rhizophagus irregularis]
MAGIPHPYFDWDDSIPDFLAQLRLDLQNRRINSNDNAAGPPTGRDNAIGHLRACMRGRTLEWFDDEITTKQNWELTNLLDNTGQVNLVAVNGRTAVQIGANALNEAVGQPGNAIVKLRAVEDAWNEDWHIAGGCPTNASVNAPNANAGNTVADIRFGQAVWWLKTYFPTVEEELQDLIRANYRPKELRRKFLDALPLLWLEKAEDIGEHLPLDELAKKLYEIELRRIARHKRDRTSDPLSQQHGISLEDMQKAIQNALAQQKTEYQSLLEKQKADFQSQIVQQTKKIPPPVPPKNMEQLLDTYESANPIPDTLTREEIMRVVTKAYEPPPKPQKPEKLQSSRIDRLESKIDEIGQMTFKFARRSLNDQSQKPFYCSNCRQKGHKKNDCPRLNPVAKSNFTQCYYPQLPSTQPQYMPSDSDNEEDGYNKVENGWYYALEKKNSYCLSSHHRYEKCACLERLRRRNRKNQMNTANVPVTLNDKKDKTVTVIGNFVHIDNGETEPMLFFGMSNIRKVQGIPDPNKNQFRIKLHGKAYIIPTFSKAPVVKDPSKEDQDQTSTNSSSPNSEEDLKKSA